MYEKPKPFLHPCEICGREVPFKTLKHCQKCGKLICIACTQYIEPYEPWSPIKARRFMSGNFRNLFNYPACPKCYDEIERENEENRAEEKDAWEEKLSDEEFDDWEEY